MHMPGAAADGAIVNPAGAAELAWQRLQPERWPLPPEAFPGEAALVGGAVRDALLDRLGTTPDLDLVVEGDAVALCRQLSRRHGGSSVVLDSERSMARLVIDGWSIDLARRDGDSLEADLHRRDYTINAMALPLADRQQLVDPLHGLTHLHTQQLVAVAEANLLDDPLRLLRGLRLAAQLGFALEVSTKRWIQQHHGAIDGVAGERVLAELEKVAAAPSGEHWLAVCLELGLLTPWRSSTWNREEAHRLARCSGANAQQLGLSPTELNTMLPLARLANVLDGPALQQLRSSRKLQKQVVTLRQWQQRLGGADPAGQAEALSEDQRLQLHRELEETLPALVVDWPVPRAQRWLERWRDNGDQLFHPRPAIDGLSLQRELHLQPSPALGDLLLHLMQEQAFGRLRSRDEALQRARQWLASAELTGGRAARRD
jgi:tRNA nucleotidyltransferase (CCA-adding enzyme)